MGLKLTEREVLAYPHTIRTAHAVTFRFAFNKNDKEEVLITLKRIILRETHNRLNLFISLRTKKNGVNLHAD